MEQPTLPTPTPEQTAEGHRLYTRLTRTLLAHRDWFAEGVPHEWVRALDAIQQTLTQCKREAKLAQKRETQP